VLVEDWVWEAVGVLVRWLGRLAPVRQIEALLKAAPPPLALVAFAAPVALVEPAKLWGFALIAQGRFGLGLLTLALAYGVGTVVLVRVWNVCKPALMTYRLIAWSVVWLARYRAAIHAWIETIPAWRRLIALREAIKEWARNAVRQFRARFL
jgi:hypothetical protein